MTKIIFPRFCFSFFITYKKKSFTRHSNDKSQRTVFVHLGMKIRSVHICIFVIMTVVQFVHVNTHRLNIYFKKNRLYLSCLYFNIYLLFLSAPFYSCQILEFSTQFDKQKSYFLLLFFVASILFKVLYLKKKKGCINTEILKTEFDINI